MSVTDNDNAPERTVGMSNALKEYEARASEALDVTGNDCPSAKTISRRNVFQLAYEASHTAEKCGKCGRDLAPRERVYISCVWSGYSRFGGYCRRYAPVCRDCAPPVMKGEGRYYIPHIDRYSEALKGAHRQRDG